MMVKMNYFLPLRYLEIPDIVKKHFMRDYCKSTKKLPKFVLQIIKEIS